VHKKQGGIGKERKGQRENEKGHWDRFTSWGEGTRETLSSSEQFDHWNWAQQPSLVRLFDRAEPIGQSRPLFVDMTHQSPILNCKDIFSGKH
jgi:hypothetical protein